MDDQGNTLPGQNDMESNPALINFIMLARIYDMLMIIADGLGKGDEALKLYEKHSQGEIMSSFPSLRTGSTPPKIEEET